MLTVNNVLASLTELRGFAYFSRSPDSFVALSDGWEIGGRLDRAIAHFIGWLKYSYFAFCILYTVFGGNMQAISRGPTLTEQVYLYIRDRILKGDYQPGQVISESELSSELLVSRTPVSIALTTLLERGLLEQRDTKLYVPRLTLKDILDLYTCRLAFDALATRLAATLITKKELKELERQVKVWERPVKEDDLYALWVADLSFHETIYQVSNNRHLIRFAQIAAELAAVYRRNTIRQLRDGSDQRSKEDVRLEHQRIYEALAAHDPDAAEAAAKTHIQNVIDHLSTMEVIDLGFTSNEQGL